MNEYAKMVAKLNKPGNQILTTLTPQKVVAWHMATGLVTEVAELLEFTVLEEQAAIPEDSTPIEELGDIEFYFEGL